MEGDWIIISVFCAGNAEFDLLDGNSQREEINHRLPWQPWRRSDQSLTISPSISGAVAIFHGDTPLAYCYLSVRSIVLLAYTLTHSHTYTPALGLITIIHRPIPLSLKTQPLLYFILFSIIDG